ncbi:MAG: sn-glycerol-3-phosphate ABC transporter ATP-binding protein UgpC [Oceanospirillaceae bacterium]|nr:sn-glycerol-3-phosphate ABC transporter ATP-binding protein UgpC [Oceanospirillaceae bacterium]
MSSVSLINATKNYDDIRVIHGVDLHIEAGDFCVFVGPSGCGKSTLLRMIAGLEETTAGSINIGERDVTKAEASDRGVAMVFQTYALYPHMSVRENMSFGLKMNKVPKQEIIKKVDHASNILQLTPYLDRKPRALSGGQRQRVAIGRAIVRGPEVFLFDEPLSNLDAELRVEMRVELAHLHKELGATMIYVTHDQVEAMTMADKIVVLRAGRIEQAGSPLELYNNPVNKFVAGFIGSPGMNFLKAVVENGALKVPGLNNITVPSKATLPADGTDLLVGIRPQHLVQSQASNPFKVDIIEHLGGVSYVHLHTATGEKLIVEQRGSALERGVESIDLALDLDDVMVFDAQTELRIR